MEDVFAVLVWVVVAVAAVIAIGTLVTNGRIWRQLGRGGVLSRDKARSPANARDEDIMQMHDALNERRERRGERPLSLETELAELDRPVVDSALREEIREHVLALNARRVRAGDEPLDVEAEIDRRLRGLT